MLLTIWNKICTDCYIRSIHCYEKLTFKIWLTRKGLEARRDLKSVTAFSAFLSIWTLFFSEEDDSVRIDAIRTYAQMYSQHLQISQFHWIHLQRPTWLRHHTKPLPVWRPRWWPACLNDPLAPSTDQQASHPQLLTRRGSGQVPFKSLSYAWRPIPVMTTQVTRRLRWLFTMNARVGGRIFMNEWFLQIKESNPYHFMGGANTVVACNDNVLCPPVNGRSWTFWHN